MGKTIKRIGGAKKPRHTLKAIQEHKNILDKVYKSVKTYDELLETNIKFLKGELPGTWYYDSPWGEGGDQKTHALENVTKILLNLHKKGVFTQGGQSSACGTYNLEKESEGMRAYLINEGVVAYKQRSCISGFVSVEIAQKLLPILKKDKRIYFQIQYPNSEGDFSNIPYKFDYEGFPQKFDVTLEKMKDGSWREITNMYEETYKEKIVNYSPKKYSNIRKILKEQAIFDVILRKYCEGPEADKILLDTLNDI